MYATLTDFKNPPKQYILLLALENKGTENTVPISPTMMMIGQVIDVTLFKKIIEIYFYEL